MAVSITPRNVKVLCRVCLTSSKNLIDLTSQIQERSINKGQAIHILDLLENVTSSKVVLDEKKFPSKLCQMCLSFLKISYEFRAQFKQSERLLDAPCSESVEVEQQCEDVVEECEVNSAAVELIYGNSKFDLKDVLIVEKQTSEDFCYKGFLKNLGSEVSAKFVKNYTYNKDEDLDNTVSLELIVPQHNEPSLDAENSYVKTHLPESNLSQLRLTRFESEGKLVIENINDFTNESEILKVLYECSTCKKLFPTKERLLRHKGHLHRREKFMCEKCGESFSTSSRFYHHTTKHRGKLFPCQMCPKKFETRSRLRFHFQKHQNERHFLCNICGKAFNYKLSLEYHLRIHSEDKLVCNVCGVKCTMPNTLKRHMRTHTKERPYLCEYCDKRFPSLSERRSHVMIHTGERPYTCKYCGKGFIKSDNLTTHCLSHVGPHRCEYCYKSFVEVKFLAVHMKRGHKDLLDIEEMAEKLVDYF